MKGKKEIIIEPFAVNGKFVIKDDGDGVATLEFISDNGDESIKLTGYNLEELSNAARKFHFLLDSLSERLRYLN